MKMIALTRLPDEPVTSFPAADIIPDSAITLPGKPLFLPDFAAGWEAQLLVGVRVSRLGKGMAPRFASRYYDAVTLLLRVNPLPDACFPGGLASAFDGCVQQGEWLPVPDGMTDGLEVKCGAIDVTLSGAELMLDEAVAAVGRYMTIRNGDIICPLTLPTAIPLSVGSVIEAALPALRQYPCLRARLK